VQNSLSRKVNHNFTKKEKKLFQGLIINTNKKQKTFLKDVKIYFTHTMYCIIVRNLVLTPHLERSNSSKYHAIYNNIILLLYIIYITLI